MRGVTGHLLYLLSKEEVVGLASIAQDGVWESCQDDTP